jgi:hypothetical protein
VARELAPVRLRSMLLGIQQVIMLADLAVNRALDNVAPLD